MSKETYRRGGDQVQKRGNGVHGYISECVLSLCKKSIDNIFFDMDKGGEPV